MNKSRTLLLIGIAISALLLWLALRNVSADELMAALRRTSVGWIAPFLLSLAVFCWLKSVRWARLLEPVCRTHARELVGPVVIGYMGTGLMPMQLGEVARAYLAAVRLRSRLAPVLASLVVERVLDVFALLVIVGLVGIAATELEAHYRIAGLMFLAVAVTTLVAVWLYGTYTEAFLSFVRRYTTVLPERLQASILDHLRAGAAGVQVLRRPANYFGLALLSLAQWACMCACIWMSLAAIGLFLPVLASLAVLATTIVAMTLPSAPGYIGALQIAYVLALAPFGVERSDAVAASFVYLASLWVPLVLGGLLLLHRTGLNLQDLRAPAAAPTES